MKVGDRRILIEVEEIFGRSRFNVGMAFTIGAIHSPEDEEYRSDYNIEIGCAFDDHIAGHALRVSGEDKCTRGHGWWMSQHTIKNCSVPYDPTPTWEV